MRKLIATEDVVFDTVKTHLSTKREQMIQMSSDRDKMREAEIKKLDVKLEEIKEESNLALEQIEEVTTKIDVNRKENEREEAEDEYKKQQQEDALKEKMAMEDAARFLQRKWNWF